MRQPGVAYALGVGPQHPRYLEPCVLVGVRPLRHLLPPVLDRILVQLGVADRVAPAGFRYHDLRHYFASLLIADGADIKTVQTRVRHGSATTLRTYTHLWPDKDESTRATVDAVIAARTARTEERPGNPEVVD